MMKLSDNEAAFIKNTLLEAREEFEELVREKEWFVTSTLDLLDSALEILESKCATEGSHKRPYNGPGA